MDIMSWQVGSSYYRRQEKLAVKFYETDYFCVETNVGSRSWQEVRMTYWGKDMGARIALCLHWSRGGPGRRGHTSANSSASRIASRDTSSHR